MTTTLKLVRIGNSKGLRLPAAVIRRYGLSGTVRLTETPDGLLLRPETSTQLGLEESFAEMASDGKALGEARDWAEAGIADGLGDEDFRGWPE